MVWACILFLFTQYNFSLCMACHRWANCRFSPLFLIFGLSLHILIIAIFCAANIGMICNYGSSWGNYLGSCVVQIVYHHITYDAVWIVLITRWCQAFLTVFLLLVLERTPLSCHCPLTTVGWCPRRPMNTFKKKNSCAVFIWSLFSILRWLCSY